MIGHRFVHATFVALLAASALGCHTIERRYEPQYHNSGWDPVFGSCDQCGACGGGCEGHTPGGYVGHVLRCASGCGEIYWGPWTSDPPDKCDPCDDCGNWIGPRCCEPTLWERFLDGLHGHRALAKGGKGKGKGKVGSGEVIFYDESIEGVIDDNGTPAPMEEAPEPEEIQLPAEAPVGSGTRNLLPRGLRIRSSRNER